MSLVMLKNTKMYRFIKTKHQVEKHLKASQRANIPKTLKNGSAMERNRKPASVKRMAYKEEEVVTF